MLAPLQRKIVRVVSPQAIVDNTSWTCQVIDAAGYDLVEIVVQLGATDIAMTALKVQESDVAASATALTSGADVTGAVFGTSVNDTGSASTLPSATADDTFVSILIDMRGRKRYLLLVATIGDGTAGGFIAAHANLWRAKDAPRTAAQCGFGQRLIP